MMCLAVMTQYRRVTDGRTHILRQSTLCIAIASRDKKKRMHYATRGYEDSRVEQTLQHLQKTRAASSTFAVAAQGPATSLACEAKEIYSAREGRKTGRTEVATYKAET